HRFCLVRIDGDFISFLQTRLMKSVVKRGFPIARSFFSCRVFRKKPAVHGKGQRVIGVDFESVFDSGEGGGVPAVGCPLSQTQSGEWTWPRDFIAAQPPRHDSRKRGRRRGASGLKYSPQIGGGLNEFLLTLAEMSAGILDGGKPSGELRERLALFWGWVEFPFC